MQQHLWFMVVNLRFYQKAGKYASQSLPTTWFQSKHYIKYIKIETFLTVATAKLLNDERKCKKVIDTIETYDDVYLLTLDFIQQVILFKVSSSYITNDQHCTSQRFSVVLQYSRILTSILISHDWKIISNSSRVASQLTSYSQLYCIFFAFVAPFYINFLTSLETLAISGQNSGYVS